MNLNRGGQPGQQAAYSVALCFPPACVGGLPWPRWGALCRAVSSQSCTALKNNMGKLRKGVFLSSHCHLFGPSLTFSLFRLPGDATLPKISATSIWLVRPMWLAWDISAFPWLGCHSWCLFQSHLFSRPTLLHSTQQGWREVWAASSCPATLGASGTRPEISSSDLLSWTHRQCMRTTNHGVNSGVRFSQRWPALPPQCFFIFPFHVPCFAITQPASILSSPLSDNKEALQHLWLTGDAVASVRESERGKAEQERLHSTIETAEALEEEFPPPDLNLVTLCHTANYNVFGNSVYLVSDPDCSYSSMYSYCVFSEIKLRCTAQIHHSLHWISKTDGSSPAHCQPLCD